MSSPPDIFHHVREIAEGGRLCRLPARIRAALSPAGQGVCWDAAGCELRFVRGEEPVTLTLERLPTEYVPDGSWVEVWQGPFLRSRHLLRDQPTEIVLTPDHHRDNMARLHAASPFPFDPAVTRVLLPYDASVRFHSLTGPVRPPAPEQTPALRYLAYGSSITQGACGLTTSEGYASLTARALGADLLNFGSAGSEFLEPELADFLAHEVEWDIATLEMGVNCLYKGWSAEMFAAKAEEFLSRLCAGRPDRWVFCLGIFFHHRDFEGDDSADRFRRITQEIVARRDVPRLVMLDGFARLPSAAGLTADMVHPSTDGHQQIAGHLIPAIQRARG